MQPYNATFFRDRRQMISAVSDNSTHPAVCGCKCRFWCGLFVLLTLGVGIVLGGNQLWVYANQDRLIADAQKMIRQGHPAQARRNARRVLRVVPDHPEALYVVGESHYAERDFALAIEWFDRVPGHSTQRLRADLRRVRALLSEARFEEVEKILFQRRDHAAAYEELRWLYFNQLRRREVEQLLQERLERRPDDPQVLIDFLYTEFRKQIAEEGLATLQRINEHQPGQPSIVLALGYCHWRLGEVATAWSHLKEALAMRPDHLETRLIVADFLLERGELDAAEKLLGPADATSEMAKRRSDDDRWWWLHSRLARRRGATQQALQALEQALQRRPHELAYLHRYAALLRETGRTEEAEQARERAKDLEECKSRLEFLVHSGELENPTRELCLELAELCQRRGHPAQADGWRHLAQRIP
jgi:tetratricopeptide (TPR) repeat protein